MRWRLAVMVITLPACSTDTFGGDGGSDAAADASDDGSVLFFDDFSAGAVACPPWSGANISDVELGAGFAGVPSCQVCMTAPNGYVQRLFTPASPLSGLFVFTTDIIEVGDASAPWSSQLDLTLVDGGQVYGTQNIATAPTFTSTKTYATGAEVKSIRVVLNVATPGQCFAFARAKLEQY